ncbi:MAG TPA: hypothetical protein P5158_06325 [Chitinophagaceae bacterium]|nr:hypothetical protein [Chitinophagaceae bacterium]MCB9056618.1 hypothetical protein [Chitinophagales bacterium]HRX93709.1 hypothetical protein [Chitinophagaceae bacterium]
MLRIPLLLLLVCHSSFCLGQSPANNIDSFFIHEYHKTKWLTIGANYDILNSLAGVNVSNGLDERLLIHFEDFPARWIYKLQGQTDFKTSYSFDANLSLKYPIHSLSRYVDDASIGYSQKKVIASGIFQREVDLSVLSTTPFIRNCGLLLKIGHQELNNKSNFGLGIGLEKIFYPKWYVGFLFSHYFNYVNYSVFLQSFIINKELSLRITYERISKYDFLNLGLHFTKNNR